MAAAKQPVTVPTDASVDEFLSAVPNERRRADGQRLRTILHEVTGEPAVMWGPSIVGFGSYRYTYGSGRTGDWPLAGFSPRKQQLVLYLVGEFEERHASVLDRLGPHTAGKGCLYLKRLDDVDEACCASSSTARCGSTGASTGPASAEPSVGSGPAAVPGGGARLLRHGARRGR